MDALSLVDDVITVEEEMCFGCGNCISACPTETLSMIRRASVEPPETKDRLSEVGLR